jgi:hypothetical protein
MALVAELDAKTVPRYESDGVAIDKKAIPPHNKQGGIAHLHTGSRICSQSLKNCKRIAPVTRLNTRWVLVFEVIRYVAYRSPPAAILLRPLHK